MKRKVKVGFDFDGVVAYNPFRLARAPIAFVKRDILGIKKLNFFYPKAKWQRIFWIIIHESSIFPSLGSDLLKNYVKEQKIEAHLITARYSFLDDQLKKWLKKYNLEDIFKSVNINKKDEQPHIFKEKAIKKLNLDYYIEDNWDIVNYLVKRKQQKEESKTKVYWIYNLIDRFRHNYPYRFPYLKKALEDIIKE